MTQQTQTETQTQCICADMGATGDQRHTLCRAHDAADQPIETRSRMLIEFGHFSNPEHPYQVEYRLDEDGNVWHRFTDPESTWIQIDLDDDVKLVELMTAIKVVLGRYNGTYEGAES